MALTATIYPSKLTVSDVDRGVYDTVELRVAQHPSETLRYLLTRLVAYALELDEGIAFSRGGLSDTEDPPLSVTDLTGVRRVWIEVGSPSAERLHKASKATRRVVIYTWSDLAHLRREVASRPIHRMEAIEVVTLDVAFLDALERAVGRKIELELVRTGGQLYVTGNGVSCETRVESGTLTAPT